MEDKVAHRLRFGLHGQFVCNHRIVLIWNDQFGALGFRVFDESVPIVGHQIEFACFGQEHIFSDPIHTDTAGVMRSERTMLPYRTDSMWFDGSF